MPTAVSIRKRASFLGLAILMLAGPIAAWGGQLALLTKVPPRRAPDTASGASGSPSLSADGRYLAFVSSAPNLSPGQIDDNWRGDVFLHDRIAGTVTLVSHAAGSAATAGNQESSAPTISADGRWVAFQSTATNLVDGQVTAGSSNVFLYDRLQGTVTLVSHARSSPRTSGAGSSGHPVLSADGRYLAFDSFARDLINPPVGGGAHINVFLYDRAKDKTVLVSRKAGSATTAGNAEGDLPSISANGRYVAFRGQSSDLVPGQTEPEAFSQDVFVFDRDSGSTLLVSHALGSTVTAVGGDQPVISADGADVVFTSHAGNLVAGQTGESDFNVFEFHRANGFVTLVSHASASLTRTSGGVNRPAVSADGGWVAFSSVAPDLVPGQGGGDFFSLDVFLWERASGTIRMISHAFGLPAREAEGQSDLDGLSADGRRILFESDARNLVGSGNFDIPGRNNLYLYDRSSGESMLVSYAGAGGDLGGNDRSLPGALSADGGWVAFPSFATDLAPGKKDLNDSPDLFLFGRATGDRELVSRHDPGLPSSTPQARSWSSADGLDAAGRFAVFVSGAADLVPGARDTNGDEDVFLYDRISKKTTLVSRSAASPLRAANEGSRSPAISADGRYVLYQSDATDLVPGQVDERPGGSSGYSDLFLYDRVAGTTTLVSRSAASAVAATNRVQYARISADGSTVAFVSEAQDLVPGQESGESAWDVFVYDRASGAVTLLSHRDGSPTVPGDGPSRLDSLSADGRFVAVSSFADDLLPGIQRPHNTVGSLYLYDRTQEKPILVSHPASAPNQALGGFFGALSADGRFLAFESFDSGFVPGDDGPDGYDVLDVYLYDRVTGAMRLVSHAQGSTAQAGAGDDPPVISADGRFVAYSGGYAAVPPDSRHSNVHLFDRLSGQVELVSHGSRGEEANGDCSPPLISADGRYVAFISQANNLTADPVAGDAFGRVLPNVYLYDRMAKKMTLASRSFRPPFGGGNGANAGATQGQETGGLALSGSGGFVLFSTVSSNLAPGDFNRAAPDVFLYSPVP